MLYPDHSYSAGGLELRVLKAATGKSSEDKPLGLTFGDGDCGFLPLVADEAGLMGFDDYAGVRGKVLLVTVSPGCWQQPAETFLGLKLPAAEKVAQAVSTIRPALTLLARLPQTWDAVELSRTLTQLTRTRCITADKGLRINIHPPGVIVDDKVSGPHEIEPVAGADGRLGYRRGG